MQPTMDSSTDTETTTSDDRDYLDIMLGLDSRYIPGAPDILSLFFLQNGIPSYTKFSDSNADKALGSYLAFSGQTALGTAEYIL